MKWNKAIEQIEKALADGKRVEVSFHRKWARNCNEYKTDRVDCVSAYDWNGETCKGVSTFEGYGLDEGNFIIDDVIVDEDKTEEPTATSETVESVLKHFDRIAAHYTGQKVAIANKRNEWELIYKDGELRCYTDRSETHNELFFADVVDWYYCEGGFVYISIKGGKQ